MNILDMMKSSEKSKLVVKKENIIMSPEDITTVYTFNMERFDSFTGEKVENTIVTMDERELFVEKTAIELKLKEFQKQLTFIESLLKG